MSQTLLEIRDVTLAWGTRVVLRGVNLAIDAGQRWAWLGENGAGKSTLLRACAGLMNPARGEINRSPALFAAGGIACIPQRCEFSTALPTTVREFVSLGLIGLKLSGRERQARLEEALATVGMTAHARADYASLSGGLRQRALAARALARRPALLLADEPAGGLDASSEDDLWRALLELNSARGMTLVVVTHDHARAARHATHTATFAGGAVAAAPGGGHD